MKDLTAANAKRSADKADKKAQALKVILTYNKGFTIKEVAVDSRMPSQTVRNYINEFLESGEVQNTGIKDGKSCVYIHSDYVTDKKEEEYKEAVAKQEEAAKEEPEKVHAGREFKDPRSVTSVVAGDVSWVSSRSGSGLFYRYLILIVHSAKATCVNVFPEGHEAVNINDPNFIYIGEDPESGEKLYADLTNVCQRRFYAFGERCMHIASEHMENVKNRMARLLKVDIHPVGDQGTVQKLKKDNEKLSESLKTASENYKKLSLDYASYREGVNNQFKGIVHEKQEADKARDELQAKLDASVAVIDKLNAENNDLKDKLIELDNECKDSGVLETEDSDHMTDLYIILAKYEAQKELLEKQLSEYLAIIDRLLPANKEV